MKVIRDSVTSTIKDSLTKDKDVWAYGNFGYRAPFCVLGGFMTNNNFVCYPEEKRKAKLKNVLKAKTRDYLTEGELDTVIGAVKVKRQYQVKLYFDEESFKNTLIYPKLGKAEVVLGEAVIGDKNGVGRLVDEGQPTVVIVRKRNCSPENQIHIFVPKQRTEKTVEDENAPMILCDRECVDEKFICSHIECERNFVFCEFFPPVEEVEHAKA